jgi:hypothetical protein
MWGQPPSAVRSSEARSRCLHHPSLPTCHAERSRIVQRTIPRSRSIPYPPPPTPTPNEPTQPRNKPCHGERSALQFRAPNLTDEPSPTKQVEEMQPSAERPCTKFRNSLPANREQSAFLGHSQVAQAPPIPLAGIPSTFCSPCEVQPIPARASRQWPLPSEPWSNSDRSQVWAFLPVAMNGWGLNVDRLEPGRRTGGGIYQIRRVATRLGRPCRPPKARGQKSAWEVLCDRQTLGRFAVEQAVRWTCEFPKFARIMLYRAWYYIQYLQTCSQECA